VRLPRGVVLERYSRAVVRRGGTRELIVGAAASCVSDGLWETVSLRDVRDRAGVSNGSLFHHFATRQELERAVVAAALNDHQRALLDALGSAPKRGVTGVVRRHLHWVADNPGTARLLLSTPPDVLRDVVSIESLQENRQFFQAVGRWLARQGWPGNPGLPIVLAVWIGPAQEHARRNLPDNLVAVTAAADVLGAAAWAALGPYLRPRPVR
jgi:AcrR family transcriptional regulator